MTGPGAGGGAVGGGWGAVVVLCGAVLGPPLGATPGFCILCGVVGELWGARAVPIRVIGSLLE